MTACAPADNQETLQLLAVDCMQPLAHPALETPVTTSLSQGRASSPSSNGTGASHSDLMQHFQGTLSRLVSCSGDSRSFAAFTTLANEGQSSSRALYLSILAWAGRHLANSGKAKYEAVSERLGEQASTLVLAQLAQETEEKDRMTLLAAALMVMQFKVSDPVLRAG